MRNKSLRKNQYNYFYFTGLHLVSVFHVAPGSEEPREEQAYRSYQGFVLTSLVKWLLLALLLGFCGTTTPPLWRLFLFASSLWPPQGRTHPKQRCLAAQCHCRKKLGSCSHIRDYQSIMNSIRPAADVWKRFACCILSDAVEYNSLSRIGLQKNIHLNIC